jgi:hypothetical protein
LIISTITITTTSTITTINRYLRTGYLWDNVRVMGGAYGGFCNFNPNTGLFSFLSYRDPNLHKTLQIYDGCADYLTKLHLPAGTKLFIPTITFCRIFKKYFEGFCRVLVDSVCSAAALVLKLCYTCDMLL